MIGNYVTVPNISSKEIISRLQNICREHTFKQSLDGESLVDAVLEEYNDEIPGLVFHALLEDLAESRRIVIETEMLQKGCSFNELAAVINGIISRANEQHIRISPRLLAAYLHHVFDADEDTLLESMGGTVHEFFAVYTKDAVLSLSDTPSSIGKALESFMDLLCLEMDDNDIDKLNMMALMSEVFAFLDAKAAARRPNDSLVRFGSNWSCTLRNTSRTLLGSGGSYPKPYPMKHILGQSGLIIPRPKHFTGFCVIAITSSPNNLHCSYATLNDLIDGGWAVD
ncbi:MAG: hypothetical protein GXY34_15455 [Syntrophomonadaceae bacterium]|nr:hypothetical protein [Syntrophomonadaceae bacterium]